jgi:hypothetical protein
MGNEVKEMIAPTANIAGIRVRDQMTMNPRAVMTTQDLWNARHRQHKRDLGGCTATGTLIKLLDTKNINYEVSWHP